MSWSQAVGDRGWECTARSWNPTDAASAMGFELGTPEEASVIDPERSSTKTTSGADFHRTSALVSTQWTTVGVAHQPTVVVQRWTICQSTRTARARLITTATARTREAPRFTASSVPT